MSRVHLTVRSSPGSAPGLLALSLGRPTPPPRVLPQGVTLWLDAPTLMLYTALPAQPIVTVPLNPIPNLAALAGVDVFAQTMHGDPQGWAASDGLWFTFF